MKRRSVLIAGAAVVLVGAATTVGVRAWPSDEPAAFVGAAWLPVWEERGAASLSAALEVGALAEVSPTWVAVGPDGDLVLTPPTREVQDELADAGVDVLPVVQNFSDGAWQPERMADVLTDPALAEFHREELVEAALEEGWAGVDIDYEALPPTVGPAFADFLTALADDLHDHDLILSVAIPARADDEDPGTLAYSYQALGAAADQVRVMAYDHSWSSSAAGPVAPVSWVRDVVEYAVARVPREKLMLGLATYGYDWTGQQGTFLPAVDAVSLADRVGARPEWDDDSASVTFAYEDDDGRQHTVWFEDARSVAAKQRVAVDAGLRGVALWQLGGEDPDVWPAVAEATARSAP